MSSEVITSSPSEEPLDWGWEGVQAAFFQGTPEEGMMASGVLAVVVFVATTIPVQATIVIDLVFVLLFILNALRIPWGWIR